MDLIFAFAQNKATILTLLIAGLAIVGLTLAEAGSQKVGMFGSKDNVLVDPNIQPSTAGVFTATYPITRVSGINAVTGITVPYNGFHGTIILLPTAIFTWTAATNIALAGSAVVGKALHFTYDPYSAKWYPSYIA